LRSGLPFVPVGEIGDRPNVMADGAALASTTLTLSHWPGSDTPEPLRHDLSAGIAFRYVRSRRRWPAAEAVTLDHFDQDGLLSVFVITDPPRASDLEARLMDVAAAGDFDVYTARDSARVAFALAGMAPGPGSDPADAYRSALEQIPALVAEPGAYRTLWEEEDDRLAVSEAALSAGRIRIEEDRALDLAVVEADPGIHVHPMSIHNRTTCTRVLLLAPPRFTLHFRYETWVRLVSRRTAPRVDLGRLASTLSGAEPAGRSWRFNGVRATVARLEPEGGESDLAPERVRRAAEDALRASA